MKSHSKDSVSFIEAERTLGPTSMYAKNKGTPKWSYRLVFSTTKWQITNICQVMY